MALAAARLGSETGLLGMHFHGALEALTCRGCCPAHHPVEAGRPLQSRRAVLRLVLMGPRPLPTPAQLRVPGQEALVTANIHCHPLPVAFAGPRHGGAGRAARGPAGRPGAQATEAPSPRSATQGPRALESLRKVRFHTWKGFIKGY